VYATNQMQERGNRAGIAYLFNLVRSLVSWHSQELHIHINREHIHRKIFSLSVGIGRFSGGGMRQTPDALIDDGLFDVTLYEDMSCWKVVRHVHRLYNGSILNVDTVKSYRTRRLVVHNGKGVMAQIDGELIYGDKFDIEIMPSALSVLV